MAITHRGKVVMADEEEAIEPIPHQHRHPTHVGKKRHRSPTKMRFSKGRVNNDNRDDVARERRKENQARAKQRRARSEPKVMPFERAKLEQKGVRELRKLATVALGIGGASRMTKAELIERMTTVRV